MTMFKFDEEKAISVLLYISNNVQRSDLHKVFKIMYFAEQKHLSQYGRPIVGDDFIAMENGPVPSKVYDLAKLVKSDRAKREIQKSFEVKGYFIHPKVKPNMDELSESDIECLDESIAENKDLTFGKLKEKSHDKAYEQAGTKSYFNEIAYEDMAKVGGADKNMLAYIKLKATK